MRVAEYRKDRTSAPDRPFRPATIATGRNCSGASGDCRIEHTPLHLRPTWEDGRRRLSSAHTGNVGNFGASRNCIAGDRQDSLGQPGPAWGGARPSRTVGGPRRAADVVRKLVAGIQRHRRAGAHYPGQTRVPTSIAAKKPASTSSVQWARRTITSSICSAASNTANTVSTGMPSVAS